MEWKEKKKRRKDKQPGLTPGAPMVGRKNGFTSRQHTHAWFTRWWWWPCSHMSSFSRNPARGHKTGYNKHYKLVPGTFFLNKTKKKQTKMCSSLVKRLFGHNFVQTKHGLDRLDRAPSRLGMNQIYSAVYICNARQRTSSYTRISMKGGVLDNGGRMEDKKKKKPKKKNHHGKK